jgi:hypothetical protein
MAYKAPTRHVGWGRSTRDQMEVSWSAHFGERPPKSVRGPFSLLQSNQKSIVAGVRHYLVRDHTGLERLDAVAEARER